MPAVPPVAAMLVAAMLLLPSCASFFSECVMGNCLCNGKAACTLRCDPDQPCDALCDNADECTVDCTGNPLCDVDATSHTQSLVVDCTGADFCDVNCADADSCDVDCADAGQCVVICSLDNCEVHHCAAADSDCHVVCVDQTFVEGEPVQEGSVRACRG